MKQWSGKRYYSLDHLLKQQYGEKLYKITLNAGMTCPNRDGTVGSGGCIFCSAKGSGDFAGDERLSITDQLAAGKEFLKSRRPAQSFIAYFQAYTNTYERLDVLEKLYFEAVQDPQIRILAIATRPDCLGDDIIALLTRINQIKPVWIELGLQTIHPETARLIRRGYDLAVFEDAVRKLRAAGITVIVHVILCLPDESEAMMLETIDYLNKAGIQGIKLQILHILRNTDLALEYQCAPFWLPTMNEYIALLSKCIARLNPDITIHRLTGDGPRELLIAPLWTLCKRTVLNQLNHSLSNHDIWQGKEYYD